MVGLTGGIGAGKSAVSALLGSYGAVVVDADLVAREVVETGSAGLASIVEEFGQEALQPDGSLDRGALGSLVFGDPAALARLNAVLHPLIGARTTELVEQARAAGAEVLVHDVPLLVENGLAPLYDAVVVVAASPLIQLDRLTRIRGLTEAEARARIDSQAPLSDKLAVATHVINNGGPIRELAPQVRRLWQELEASAKRERDSTPGVAHPIA